MKCFLGSIRKRVCLGLPAGMLLMTAVQASAATISYTHSGHGAGTLDDIAFDSDFVITATADTSTIYSCDVSCWSNNNISAAIHIDTLGDFTFVTPTRFFSNSNIIGFARAAGGDLYDGPSIPAWDLASSIGPISGTATLSQWSGGANPSVETSGGVLVFYDGSGSSTFTASVAAVPVPAGAWLLGSGLMSVVGARRKFRQA